MSLRKVRGMGEDSDSLIPKHGGYRNLKSFQLAQLAYDLTVRFCDKYIDRRSRTHDQMVQAARSGTQNIAEGSKASGTSKKTELKLTNVARSSLEELMLDYEDFLRQRGWDLWERNDVRRQELVDLRCKTADEVARWVKQVHARELRQRKSPQPQSSTSSTGSTPSTSPEIPAIAANAIHVVVTAANSLLDKQLRSLAASFEREGGFTERLYRVRSHARQQSARNDTRPRGRRA